MVLALLGGLGALAWSAYQTGTVLARREVTGLEERTEQLDHQLDAATTRIHALETDLTASRQATEALRKRYDAEVPVGAMATLQGIARERIQKGVSPTRLQDVVKATTEPRSCDAQPVRRRFAIQLPGTQPRDTAWLLEGLIGVTATLPTAKADPARDTVITLNTAWAEEPMKRQGLPFTRDIPINNAVLHLTVEASDVPLYAVASLTTCGRTP